MSIENGCIEHQYYQTFARESEDNRVTRLQKDANKTSKWSFFSIFIWKKIQKQKFYSRKKRIELRSKRVNSEANFRPFTQASTPAQV